MEEQAWAPAYLDQPEFIAFLEDTEKEYSAIFEELGILVK